MGANAPYLIHEGIQQPGARRKIVLDDFYIAGVAARSSKRREASLDSADGVVLNLKQNAVEFGHHPVRSIREASRRSY